MTENFAKTLNSLKEKIKAKEKTYNRQRYNFFNTCFYWADNENFSEVVSDIVPYCKVAVLTERADAKTLEIIKNLNIRNIKTLLIEKQKAVFSVSNASGLFNIPTDVRAVVLLSESLYDFACYFIGFRNIPLIYYVQDSVPFDFLEFNLIVKNENKLDRINLFGDIHIVLSENIASDNFISSMLCYIIKCYIDYIDYLLEKIIMNRTEVSTNIEKQKYMIEKFLLSLREGRTDKIKGSIISLYFVLKLMNLYGAKTFSAVNNALLYFNVTDIKEIFTFEWAYSILIKERLRTYNSYKKAWKEKDFFADFMDNIKDLAFRTGIDLSYLTKNAVEKLKEINNYCIVNGISGLESNANCYPLQNKIENLSSLLSYTKKNYIKIKNSFSNAKEMLSLMAYSPLEHNGLSIFNFAI